MDGNDPTTLQKMTSMINNQEVSEEVDGGNFPKKKQRQFDQV